VTGIPADRWHTATPCEGWDVHALLNHVVSGNLWAAELAAGATIESVGDRLDGDVLGADPAGSYATSAKAAAAAFLRPGALDAPCAVSYGPVPGSVYAGHRFIDVFIHGWDLATATGHNTAHDPDLMEACTLNAMTGWGGMARGRARGGALPSGVRRPVLSAVRRRPAAHWEQAGIRALRYSSWLAA
jgi:uncharacterized protein (TIGR03086 family)